VPQPEVERRMGVIQKSVSTMPAEFTAVHFDRIYSSPDPPFKTDASQFLARAIEGRKAGRALDVAMGQGRNSLFLAGRGWDVTGYDLSAEGLARAGAQAQKLGLTIRTVQSSHEKFDYGREQWDLIVQTFAFTNLADEAYRRRVIDSLKPGGMLVIEGFGGGPKNVMMESFRDLRVVLYEDRPDVADWGLQQARLTRLAAVKE
jgi:SAM-dependent methyltransferase